MDIKEIIDRVQLNDDLIDVEKAAFLSRLFEEECKPYKNEIHKLISKYD